jgi:hypothetical protein
MPTQFDNPAPTTFGTTSARQSVGCRVCGRTLLMGERSVGFFAPNGDGPFDVCELCVPRAHRYGLRSRPSSPDEVARVRRGGIVRRMRAALGGDTSGGREPRRRAATRPEEQPAHGSAAVAATVASPGTGRRGRRRAASAAARGAMPLGAVPVGSAAIPIALAAFNQSPHARTLAGLTRTLGAPRASVAPRSGTDREVILTVAWEIVWYQFRIMPDGIEQQRGQYLGELQPRWQHWNCAVSTDGTVREQGDVSALNGHDPLNPSAAEAPTR